MTGQLHARYTSDVVPALQKQFEYTNPMQAPRLRKIVVGTSSMPARASTTVNERTTHMATTARPSSGTNPGTNGHTAVDGPAAAGLAALIAEAEALHETLADSRTRTARLIGALRRYRNFFDRLLSA